MLPALVIIAQKGFQDHEYESTVNGLSAAGFPVVIGSTSVGSCTGKFGMHLDAQVALSDIDIADYDRVAFIGGPGAHALKDDPEAHRIAKETLKAGKILGAICIAPAILARAGVLKGKKATVWNEDGEQSALLESEGARFTGADVTVDGSIVTGNGPAAAQKFGQTFAALQPSR